VTGSEKHIGGAAAHLFEAWCRDPRPLLFSEFLFEVNGFLVLPEPVLDELDRQWEEPTLTTERELADLCRECRRRTGLGQRFAVCFIGINNFKEYSDRYGIARGEGVVLLLSRILGGVTLSECPSDCFWVNIGGHGGDEFVLVASVSQFAGVLGKTLDAFDAQIPRAYKPRKAGAIVPMMTLSVGVVTNEQRQLQHFSQIVELARAMQDYARTQPGSVFVVDRRTPMTV
jgi:diguanylate cyclase (GGDEF)-like protein